MATSGPPSISSLLKQANLDDDEEVLKACNAAIKKSKNDIEAQHVKVVALLKLDRFEDALRVIQDGGEALQAQAQLEWAYALYKAGRSEEAAELAAKRATKRGVKHVEAQAVCVFLITG
jgi:signal recognition particle subunit SRP72